MTSLLTNNAAMVALQTLGQISADLDTTNNRVSTGLRIAEAQDSAAYWAIATTTESDNGALSAVSDALALGRSTLDVMYNGLESVRDNLQKMKELLVSARQPGVDRDAVQEEINGLQTDIQNKAQASVINEENFLAVDSSVTGYNNIKSIVGSFERTSGGIAISTIELDIDEIKLVDNSTVTADAGILNKSRSATHTDGTTTATVTASVTTLDITPATVTDESIDAYVKIVDGALTETITAQNRVGVNLSRAESQENFVSALIDANDRAVGALVDADMEEESTKLRALQTQQQLAVQSLSIANTSAQNVLSLFQ